MRIRMVAACCDENYMQLKSRWTNETPLHLTQKKTTGERVFSFSFEFFLKSNINIKKKRFCLIWRCVVSYCVVIEPKNNPFVSML